MDNSLHVFRDFFLYGTDHLQVNATKLTHRKGI